MSGYSRSQVVARIADHLTAQCPAHPLRVGVDGITAAGKSTFAGELSAAVLARGRAVIQLSMDGFHHRRAHRHRQGSSSAAGYYHDAYDFGSFTRLVLMPLGPGGNRRYRTRIIDLASDQPTDDGEVQAPPDAVLIVDGTFLQQPGLQQPGRWDDVVFVDTSPELARARGTQRDAAMFGGRADAEHAYDNRYHAACRLYLDEVDPAARASILVGNDDVEHPVLRRIGGPAESTVLLFSYGTLQEPRVQLSNFGRHLDGTPDALAGHRTDWVTITDPEVIAASGSDRHPIVRPTGNPADRVPGTVFTISAAELAAADCYEVDDYRRVLARLGSGTDSWVYLAAG